MLNRRNIYLFLFVIACLLNLYAIKSSSIYLNVFLRFTRLLFLVLFYNASVEKMNKTFIIVLLVYLISSVFFTFNPTSLYGVLALAFTRIGLLKIALSNNIKRNFDKRLFIIVTVLFVGLGLLVLYLYYNNSAFFYYSFFATLLLIVLASVSFLNLISIQKPSNLYFFIAVALFIISDTIFGIQKMTKISTDFLILASVLYNVSYYLICYSEVVKHDKELK